jgi:hypothetical protein
MRIPLNVIVMCSVLVTILGVRPIYGSGPFTGDVSALKPLADRAQASQNKLRNWSGIATVTFSGGGGATTVQEVQFGYDRDTKSAFWKELVYDVSGTVRAASRISNGLMRDNKIYQVQEYKDDGVRPRYLTVRIDNCGADEKDNIKMYLDQFSPFSYYPQVIGSTPETLRFFSEHANDPGFIGGPVSLRGDRLTIEIVWEKNLNRYTLDRSNGFLVETVLRSERGEDRFTASYQTIDGVTVPNRYEVLRSAAQNGNLVESSRLTVEFRDSKVNQKLDGDAFSMEKRLDLKAGDLVDDRTMGVVYNYTPKAP